VETALARVAWDEELLSYDFGPRHPMSPVRWDLTARLCADLGLFAERAVAHRAERAAQVVPSRVLADEALRVVHRPQYVAAVRAAGDDPDGADPGSGLGTEDTPAFRGVHEAAARIAGASWDLAEAIARREILHGVNFSGGMHHAMPGRASGFCVYNDAALAIGALLAAGVGRVLYVDLDVHHGDGVEFVFADEPRVITLSIHESPATLFPGTGDPGYVGGPGARGSAVNVALPAGTADAGWLRAIHAVLPAVARAEPPEVIVSQHGCDTHVLDPLAHLLVTVDAQRAAAELVHQLAHHHAGGRWLALGGGGYEVVDVVPRTWAHLVAIAAHADVPPRTPVPEGWREYVLHRLGRTAPQRMTDGASAAFADWSTGYDPADPVDRSIMATRRAVFPLIGLDPWRD
jgi:acetoin utilization protein AcuC